jgi:hypothetical protein
MKYMFLMYGAEDAYSDEERKECMLESLAVCDELAAKGKFLATAPLQSVNTAATIRIRNDRPLITDGPFAETREHLGGFFVLDLADLDEAIAVASRLPSVRKGAAEIRPMITPDGLPPARPIPFDTDKTPYILLSYDCDARGDGPDVHSEAMGKAVALCRRLHNEGKYLNCSPLYPASTATCVKSRNGKREITDGPFAETNEVIGGFYLILAGSREEALLVAEEHARLSNGSVEVRPLFDFSGLVKK